jgi:hypothetical protein
LAATLTAGIRPVDVLFTILVALDGRCAVALTEVALTRSPVAGGQVAAAPGGGSGIGSVVDEMMA